MRRSSMIIWVPSLAGILAAVLLAAGAASHAQPVCRGDVNRDGFVTEADLEPLLEVMFDPESASSATLAAADVNADGDVTAADAVGVVILNGLECFPGASTSTPTRTRTPTTAPGTPVATSTPPPTATATPSGAPTPACIAQPLAVGGSQGALTAADCEREFRQELRRTDEYTWVGQEGQAVRILVAANGFTPWVRIVDPNGHFEVAEGGSPVEVRTTTDLPYTILVSSAPGTESELGSYELSVSTRNCPTTTLTTRNAALGASACPAPWEPSFGDYVERADVYTFQVTVPLTTVSITMRQSIEDSLLDPLLTVYGPGGYEVFPAFQADDLDLGGFGFDAFARFSAVETGTYTVVATGDHCDPQDVAGCGYRLITGAIQCPRTSLANIPDATRMQRSGVLSGDPLATRCAAPLPIPGTDDFGVPEVGSPADFYTFTANAGDVITVEMESEDDPQVYIFGPVEAGNPFLARDDDRNADLFARVGVTLTQTGTYTIVAANKNYLLPKDPLDPEDVAETIEYTLFLQKCPVRGAIVPGPASVRNDAFNALDCVNADDLPVRSYAVNVEAGTFLDVALESTGFDAFVTLVAPDGTRFSNDDDPFTAGSTDARVNRLASVAGTYFVEATVSPEGVSGPTALSFTLRPRTCSATSASTGMIDGTLSEGDCDLGDGRRYDVVTYTAPVDAAALPRVASVAPSAGMCVLPLLPFAAPNHPVVCSRQAVEVPLVRTGAYAWILAGASAAQRGAYSVDFAQCATTPVTFGSALTGLLQQGDCGDALGVPADWFAFRADAGFTRFADGLQGQLAPAFPARFSLAGADGTSLLAPNFGIDLESFYSSGTELVALMKLAPDTAGAAGSYGLAIDVPFRLQ